MNRLLVLTDFSTAVEAALQYAAAVAGAHSLPLSVLHRPVVPVPLPFTGPDEMLLPPMPVVAAEPGAEDRLAETIARLRAAFPDLQLQGRVVYGTSDATAFDDEALPADATLVVPNKAAGYEENTWPEADVSALLRDAHRTVLAVSPHAVYRPVRAIGLALDPTSEVDAAVWAPLLAWVRLTGARLHILRVAAGPAPAAAPIAALDAATPQYHTLTDAGDIDSGLLHLIKALELDWLAITPHRHGLLGGLFHKDHLPPLVRACPVPLLALHQEA